MNRRRNSCAMVVRAVPSRPMNLLTVLPLAMSPSGHLLLEDLLEVELPEGMKTLVDMLPLRSAQAGAVEEGMVGAYSAQTGAVEEGMVVVSAAP